jgi:hypothetical protein
MTLGEAKERVSVPALWERYGFNGNPSKSCKSPFREDTNPSFSVFENGRRWKDHGTGDGGDAITFIEKAEGPPPPPSISDHFRPLDVRNVAYSYIL